MYLIYLFYVLCLTFIEASRILVVVPTPSVSHQVVFYPLINELLKRGHEIVFITTDAQFAGRQAPTNLTEIDTHDIAYKLWRAGVMNSETTQGTKDDLYTQVLKMAPLLTRSFELQMQTPEVQDLIKKKTHFDLIIIEGGCKSVQAISHVFKAPVILMSSMGLVHNNLQVLGAPTFPKLIYGNFLIQKLNNRTIFDKLRVLWDDYKIDSFLDTFRVEENKIVKRLFGPDTPSLEELGSNVHMVFWNLYPIWEMNRPVPPNGILIGGIHQKPQKELPQDLKAYLDSSRRGVVYFSLGTNVSPSTLPPEKVQSIIKALSKLPYDILMKWDSDELYGTGKNIKVAKWLPQSDLLRHPSIKAFITQGGLQSFDEALTGGVPLVGIPMLGDQWYNVERISALEIGVGLLMDDLTEQKLVDAVNAVINDPKYRRNMVDLREKLRDQPMSGLETAVWWTEYVLRHKGAAHLKPVTANMSWAEYLDVELMAVLASAALIILTAVATILYMILIYLKRILNVSVKLKVK